MFSLAFEWTGNLLANESRELSKICLGHKFRKVIAVKWVDTEDISEEEMVMDRVIQPACCRFAMKRKWGGHNLGRGSEVFAVVKKVHEILNREVENSNNMESSFSSVQTRSPAPPRMLAIVDEGTFHPHSEWRLRWLSKAGWATTHTTLSTLEGKISRIRVIKPSECSPGNCKADETVSKYKGTYKWLLTNPTETAQTRCIKNEDGNATRICLISINTGKSQWEKPKFKQCKLLQELPDKIVDLANITISDEIQNKELQSTAVPTPNMVEKRAKGKDATQSDTEELKLWKNAEDVAEHILNLINESPSLDKEETKIIVSKVSDISQCDEISMNLTHIILQIINVVLEKQNDSASDLHEVSNEILRIIEHAGHKMEFSGQRANLMVAGLALAVLRMDHTFDGMAFSIHSYEEGTDPEPLTAQHNVKKSLRKDLNHDLSMPADVIIKNVTKALTTYVVSASVSDMFIQNLADPVVITLQHIEGNQEKRLGMVIADWGALRPAIFTGNIRGYHRISENFHTESTSPRTPGMGWADGIFQADLSRSTVDTVNEQILALITYTGCGISSIFLGVALLTYIAFHKLRKDYPAKILINLCTALLMLNLYTLKSIRNTEPKAVYTLPLVPYVPHLDSIRGLKYLSNSTPEDSAEDDPA
ncbi:Adhesion G-protein coupled receptor G4 [Saguinus oedipus]|uniref:Adhesion G-protein coupled receptor G4 n=1 Tax=Saguinus oedipus TaxID=9490 RepID=A0ABQ9TH19_SAGOE|nr:Adhesion G-protein coupled receptor G4 [Saguinus oedipus]